MTRNIILATFASVTLGLAMIGGAVYWQHLLTVALVMAAMVVVMAAPAFASPPAQANEGLAKAYAKSGGKSPVPACPTLC